MAKSASHYWPSKILDDLLQTEVLFDDKFLLALATDLPFVLSKYPAIFAIMSV